MLASVKETIKKYNLQAKKNLGQNFLINESLTDKIVRIANLAGDDIIYEIGSGPGCLTRSILKAKPSELHIIEKDKRFLDLYAEIEEFYQSKLIIHNIDALDFDYSNSGKITIIANLPYNIAAKLITNWLENYQNIKAMYLMVQDEMADRIVADTKKDFGRLGVLCNFAALVKKEFKISPQAFTPAPKVNSAIVSFQIYEKPLYDINLKSVGGLSHKLFLNRRKNLRNIFKQNNWNIEILEQLEISYNKRAEELSLQQVADIFKKIGK